jgi:hypothetical protein
MNLLLEMIDRQPSTRLLRAFALDCARLALARTHPGADSSDCLRALSEVIATAAEDEDWRRQAEELAQARAMLCDLLLHLDGKAPSAEAHAFERRHAVRALAAALEERALDAAVQAATHACLALRGDQAALLALARRYLV